MTTYYQVTLNGRYSEQDIVNVLWYRETNPLPSLPDFNAYAAAISAEVYDNIWHGVDTPPNNDAWRMRNVMTTGYELLNITVMAWADDFQIVSTTPYIRDVNETGRTTDGTNGPATVVIANARLEPAFGPGIGLPKKGHLKFGPLEDGTVLNTGRLDPTWETRWNAVAHACAVDIVTEAPVGLFYPIRVKLTRVAGVITLIGYRDVSDFVINPVARMVRSRLPE